MSLKYWLLLGSVMILHECAADSIGSKPSTHSSGVINDYADKALELIRSAMVRKGFDPFKVDDISRDFWFKPLLVNYTGHLDLTNGWLQDLSTIRRLGDAKIKYEKKLLTIKIDLIVDSLLAHFNHKLKIFEIGPSGLFSATIRKQEINFGLIVDFERLTFHLQQFALTKNDQVKLKITGLGLADPLFGVLVDTLTIVFKDIVTNIIGRQIRSAIDLLFSELPPLLPPAPDQKPLDEFLMPLQFFLTNFNQFAYEEPAFD